MDSRTQVYIRPEIKVKIMRKAQRLGISVSKLLVEGALQYVPIREKEKYHVE